MDDKIAKLEEVNGGCGTDGGVSMAKHDISPDASFGEVATTAETTVRKAFGAAIST